jgi:tetratricopeptide (TPR) repeat protein
MDLRSKNGHESPPGPVIPSVASPVPTGSRENPLLMFFSQKQILRFLESDGLHRSPEIGTRRYAPRNGRMAGWAGRIACLLVTFAIAPFSLGSQDDASKRDKSGSLAARAAGRPVQTANVDTPKQLKPLEDLIEQGQYQQTVQGLENYLHDHESSAKAHYDLGYVFFRTHQIGGAVRELSRSLQLNDKDAQAHKILGLVCTFVGRYDLAEAELQAAAQLEPNSAEIHYFLGRIYYTRQVFPMARTEFQAAIQLNPGYMKAYNNLGLVMEVLGKNDEAVQAYTTAAQINETQHLNSPWPFEYLSAHYNRQRQPALALEFAQKALLIDSKCDLAYYDLAQAFQTESDWQKAADAVQKAIAINSSTAEYFYLLSRAQRRLGKIPESDAALKRFEEIRKDQDTTAKVWRDASHEPDLPPPPAAHDNEH